MEIHDKLGVNDALGIKAGVMLKDGIELEHFLNLHAVMRNEKTGEIVDEQWISNQVQTAMLQHVADQMSDQGETAMGWMEIGTGTGQAVGDATLATALNRQALDSGTPSHAAGVITYHRLFAAGEGIGTVTEAGVFNAAAAGIMGLYDDTISFNKTAANSLELTWTLTVS